MVENPKNERLFLKFGDDNLLGAGIEFSLKKGKIKTALTDANNGIYYLGIDDPLYNEIFDMVKRKKVDCICYDRHGDRYGFSQQASLWSFLGFIEKMPSRKTPRAEYARLTGKTSFLTERIRTKIGTCLIPADKPGLFEIVKRDHPHFIETSFSILVQIKPKPILGAD